MLKFIRSKGHQQPTAERVKLQKELYAFRKVSQPRIISLVHKNTKLLHKFCGNKNFLSAKHKITPFGKIKYTKKACEVCLKRASKRKITFGN